jgi:hypothetical protein
METTIQRTTRCCSDKPGGLYGTVTSIPAKSNITVQLQGTPCCDQEFATLIQILQTLRLAYDKEQPLYLLYKLDNVQLSPTRMAQQEAVLKSDQTFCAVVVEKPITRRLMKLAICHKKNAKVCATMADGQDWLGTSCR